MAFLHTVSVIIATKRTPFFFEQSLRSVVCQHYRPTEILIVDDGSGYGDIKKNILYNIVQGTGIYWHIEINKFSVGVAEARNQAIAHSSGDWLAILDDDDVWYPNYLQTFLGASGLASRHWMFCLPRRDLLLSSYYKFWDIPEAIHRLLYRGVGKASGLMFPRAGFDELGGFDSAYKIVNDRDLMFRLLLAGYTPIEIVGSLFSIGSEGGLTSDLSLWLEEALCLLENFFTFPGSDLYIAEKDRAIEFWKSKLVVEFLD